MQPPPIFGLPMFFEHGDPGSRNSLGPASFEGMPVLRDEPVEQVTQGAWDDDEAVEDGPWHAQSSGDAQCGSGTHIGPVVLDEDHGVVVVGGQAVFFEQFPAFFGLEGVEAEPAFFVAQVDPHAGGLAECAFAVNQDGEGALVPSGGLLLGHGDGLAKVREKRVGRGHGLVQKRGPQGGRWGPNSLRLCIAFLGVGGLMTWRMRAGTPLSAMGGIIVALLLTAPVFAPDAGFEADLSEAGAQEGGTIIGSGDEGRTIIDSGDEGRGGSTDPDDEGDRVRETKEKEEDWDDWDDIAPCGGVVVCQQATWDSTRLYPMLQERENATQGPGRFLQAQWEPLDEHLGEGNGALTQVMWHVPIGDEITITLRPDGTRSDEAQVTIQGRERPDTDLDGWVETLVEFQEVLGLELEDPEQWAQDLVDARRSSGYLITPYGGSSYSPKQASVVVPLPERLLLEPLDPAIEQFPGTHRMSWEANGTTWQAWMNLWSLSRPLETEEFHTTLIVDVLGQARMEVYWGTGYTIDNEEGLQRVERALQAHGLPVPDKVTLEYC
jgi:hypothetical protein